MRTRIISAFPGTGKTEFYKQHSGTTLDSDSSLFSWVTIDGTKVRNPHFPDNYINHIQSNIGKYEFILVSSHKEVRDALLNNCLFFYLIYPEESRKSEFIQRYRKRGSPETFVNLIDKNWETWINECEWCDIGCKGIQMILPNLVDEINYIIKSEETETT